jgi:predicted nuclease with TOPRIM domain
MEPPDDSLTKEELEAALRAADQRGVQYYVQLQSALVELSEKQQVILRTEEQLKQLREELQQKERENQSVAEAYESQIQLLSERLAELA